MTSWAEISEKNTLFSPVNGDSFCGEGEGEIFDVDFSGFEIEERVGIFVPGGGPDTDNWLGFCFLCFH